MTDISSPFQVLFNILLFIIIFIILNKKYFNWRVNYNNTTVVWACVLVLLFCLFPYWGSDYWHYLYGYYEMRAGAKTNMEDVYYTLANIAPTYFLFRLTIWGGALLLLLLSFHRLKLNIGLALFFFVCLFIPLFSYARVSVAMSMAFCGLAFIITSNKRIPTTLFGLGLIVASFFFHKSAVFGIVVATIGLVTLISDRLSIAVVVLLVPILMSAVRLHLLDFMDLSSDEFVAIGVGQQYLGEEADAIGISQLLRIYLQRLALLLVLILNIKISFEHSDIIPDRIKVYANTATICIAAVFILLLSGTSLNISKIAIRLSYYAWIPTIIFMSYCCENNLYVKWVKGIWSVATISTIFDLSYSLYCSINNMGI